MYYIHYITYLDTHISQYTYYNSIHYIYHTTSVTYLETHISHPKAITAKYKDAGVSIL